MKHFLLVLSTSLALFGCSISQKSRFLSKILRPNPSIIQAAHYLVGFSFTYMVHQTMAFTSSRFKPGTRSESEGRTCSCGPLAGAPCFRFELDPPDLTVVASLSKYVSSPPSHAAMFHPLRTLTDVSIMATFRDRLPFSKQIVAQPPPI
jgi:hypothetical protein